jgi:hypothetical protein
MASSSSKLSSSLSLSSAGLLLTISLPLPMFAGWEELLVSLRGSNWLHAGWVWVWAGWVVRALAMCI